MRAVEMIVQNANCLWRYNATGELYIVVWVAPMEVIAISESGAWLGRASHFVQEFEVTP
jgi:hypothetical protein